MGPAATRHVLAAALHGIYAAPLDRLAARAVFGHRKSRNVRMAAPAGGMGSFVSRLHVVLAQRGVTFHFGRPVTMLDPDVPTWVCTSAPTAARLITPHAPDAAARIGRVELAALASVTAFFPTRPDDLHGFGVLFPRDAGIRALGVLFNSDIFPGRGPHRSETWIYGGATRDALAPEADLPALLRADRLALSGRAEEPIGTHLAYWPAAFPIYDHAIVALGDIDRHLPPWLHVAGNYLGRRGVSDLI
jgi:protoporphyrinogen oxidase